MAPHSLLPQNIQVAINEYLLVLTPHEDLSNKLTLLRKEFAETFHTAPVLFPPQLTLLKFTQVEMMERRFALQMRLQAMAQHPLQVKLNGFGSYPSHSIFAKLANGSEVTNLIKGLKSIAKQLTLHKDHAPHFIQEPVFTIAQKLLPWQYEQAWQQWQHKNFMTSFMVNNMILLKRRLGEKTYRRVEEFTLMGIDKATPQPALFAA